jgi:AcrR family transcriptional regulator
VKATARGYSNGVPVRFEKPGRPRNDHVRERLRIYRAARPLIVERGVRGTTLKAVARIACISPGGIYHYFTSKTHLVLYGLNPEGLSRACTEEAADLHEELAGADPDVREVVRLYVEKNVRMLEFVRPALQAAIELGRPELKRRLSASLKEDADALVAALAGLATGPINCEEAAEAIRRTILGLAVDEGVLPVTARRQLEWLFQQIIPAVQPA